MWPITLVSSLMIFQMVNNVNSFESVRFKRQGEEDRCTTLNGDSGICIPIRECKSLLDLLLSNKYDLQVRQRIRKSHCGFIDKHPKVCCKERSTGVPFSVNNLPLLEIDLPLPTSDNPLATSKVPPIIPIDRISTENPSTIFEIPSTTSNITLATSEKPFSQSEISSTSEIPSTSESSLPSVITSTSSIPISSSDNSLTPLDIPSIAELPLSNPASSLSTYNNSLTSYNISLLSTIIPLTSEIPLTTVLSASETPSSTSGVPLLPLDIPLTTAKVPSLSLEESEETISTSQKPITTTGFTRIQLPLGLSAQLEESDSLSIFNHLPKDCGRTTVNTNRPVGGLAPLHAWPWLALVGFLRDDKTEVDFSCAGFLITDKHVITAAHCLKNQASYYKPKLIRLGEHDTNSTTDGATPVDIEIDRIIIPDEFNMQINYAGDIAIVVLKDSVTFNDGVQPICLPFTDEMRFKNYTATTCYIAGWGAQDVFASRGSHQLFETRIAVASTEKCKESFEKNNNSRRPNIAVFDDRVVCAGGGVSNACKGDSGAPLMFQEGNQIYVIGVTSHSHSKCGETGGYTMYTRVTQYLDWIATNTI